MTTPVRLDIDLGDALNFTVTQDPPTNLTGHTLSIFDAADELVGRVSATFADAVVGSITVRVDSITTLKASRGYSFRVLITPLSGASDAQALPQFLLVPK
jgi:hypothetical protein